MPTKKGKELIIKIIAVDPKPEDSDADVIVYQVPENSRAAELLLELLQDADIECGIVDGNASKLKRKRRR